MNAINPNHYKTNSGLEAIDVIEAFFHDNSHLANVFKYIARAGKKDDRLQDLKKAEWYLRREIDPIRERQMTVLPTSSELRTLLDGATPGPWEVEKSEEEHLGSPKVTQFYLSSEGRGYIAVGGATGKCYDKTEKNFTLMNLAPHLAEEVIRLRSEIDQLTRYKED